MVDNVKVKGLSAFFYTFCSYLHYDDIPLLGIHFLIF